MKSFILQVLGIIIVVVGANFFFKHLFIPVGIGIVVSAFCLWLCFARAAMRKRATPETIYSVVKDAGFEKDISLEEVTKYLAPVLQRKNYIKDDIVAALFEVFSAHDHTLYFDHRWEPADLFEELKRLFPKLTYTMERCEPRDGGYFFSAEVNGVPISRKYAVTPDDFLSDLNGVLSQVTGHSLYSVPLVADGYAFLVATPGACDKLKKNKYF